MRRFLYLMGCVCLLAVSSCELYTSHNGDLDGYWHLIGVDTLSKGGYLDMSERLVFWGIQTNLVEAVDHDNDPTHYGYIFYFEKNDHSLRILMPISMTVRMVTLSYRMLRRLPPLVSIL